MVVDWASRAGCELRVIGRSEVDEPAMSGAILIDPDDARGSEPEKSAIKIGNPHVNVAQDVEAFNTYSRAGPSRDRFRDDRPHHLWCKLLRVRCAFDRPT